MKFIRFRGRIIPIKKSKTAEKFASVLKTKTAKKATVAGIAMLGAYWTWKRKDKFIDDIQDKASDTI